MYQPTTILPIKCLLSTMAVSHASSTKTYSLLMRVEAANTPAAVSKLRRKLSDLQDESAIEMESPTSGKRLRFLDIGSEAFISQREAALNLRQKIDFLVVWPSGWVRTLFSTRFNPTNKTQNPVLGPGHPS